jgi:hypothetical protein
LRLRRSFCSLWSTSALHSGDLCCRFG